MIVYDVTKEGTFEHVQKWLEKVEGSADSDKIIKMLVGNKIDLENMRGVTTGDGEACAEDNDMLFIETSALDATNVEEAFHTIIA